MRYRFIDHVLSLTLEAPLRIETAKVFAPGDDAFSGPLGPERVPNSLILEFLATTGGYLLFRHLGRERLPLLLKLPECRFEGAGSAGDRLRAIAEVRAVSAAAGAAVLAEASGEVFAGDARVAAARLLYVCVRIPGVDPGAPECLA